MVIPMKGQYEQQCNAAALKKMGIPVLKKLKISKVEKIIDWVKNGKIIPVNYPNITQKVVDEVFKKHTPNPFSGCLQQDSYPEKKLRRISPGNILHQITG